MKSLVVLLMIFVGSGCGSLPFGITSETVDHVEAEDWALSAKGVSFSEGDEGDVTYHSKESREFYKPVVIFFESENEDGTAPTAASVAIAPKKESKETGVTFTTDKGKVITSTQKASWLAWLFWGLRWIGLPALILIVVVVLLFRVGFPVGKLILGIGKGAQAVAGWTAKGISDLIKSMQEARKVARSVSPEAADALDKALHAVQSGAGIEELVTLTKATEKIK